MKKYVNILQKVRYGCIMYIQNKNGGAAMDSVISRYSDDEVSLHHSVTDSTDRYNFYLHSHDRCELTFLISGRVSAVIGGKTYKLRKNDLLILRPNTVHGIRVDSGEDYERYNITFDDKNIVDNAFDDIPMGVDVINYSSNHYVTDLFEKLDFYCKNFSGARARALISNVVEELVCNMTLHTHNNTESDKTLLNPLLISAIEYIDESFTKPIHTVFTVRNRLRLHLLCTRVLTSGVTKVGLVTVAGLQKISLQIL